MHSNYSYASNITLPTILSPQENSKPYIIRKCIALLLSCASSKYKLRQIHAFSIRHALPLNNPDMGKHLIFILVSLSGPMSYAHKIFNQIQNPNIFTWNTMIRGYAESENPRPAIDIHHKMQLFSVEPDTHTYPFLLKAIAKLMAVREGEKVHSVTVKNGYESLVVVHDGSKSSKHAPYFMACFHPCFTA